MGMYCVVFCVDGASEKEEFDQLPDAKEIRELAAEWVAGCDWGRDGARVEVWIEVREDGECILENSLTVEVPPDHEAKISEVMGTAGCGLDPDDHDWTSDGEGGCDDNPGVWSAGGTSMSFRSHCTRCGLRREENTTGSQYNPGEHDTVRYSTDESDWV